jgi:hypothetical protein
MILSFNPPNFARVQSRALIVGIVGIALLLVGAFLNLDHFFQAYLIGFTFWTGITVGSLALLMLQHLTGGGWGLVIRRILEASTRTLPLIVALFIPVIFGAHRLYEWTNQEFVDTHAAVKFKETYLRIPFFSIRSVACLGVWCVLAFLLNRWSLQQDRTGDRVYSKYMRLLSAPGMVLLVFAVTFASIDWYMSIEPEWFSTIFGLLFFAAWGLSALAFTIAVLASLSKIAPMNEIVAPLHFHDLGKLLLALVMLWAYFAFSQFLIVWSGNLPEEIVYYLGRIHGGWGATIITIGILHFAAPFLFLLSRRNKRNPDRLVIIALVVIVMRVIDLYWVLKPPFNARMPHGPFGVTWMDIVAPIAIGGIWVWFFTWQLGKRALIPINDPQFESVMEQQHAAGH